MRTVPKDILVAPRSDPDGPNRTGAVSGRKCGMCWRAVEMSAAGQSLLSQKPEITIWCGDCVMAFAMGIPKQLAGELSRIKRLANQPERAMTEQDRKQVEWFNAVGVHIAACKQCNDMIFCPDAVKLLDSGSLGKISDPSGRVSGLN